MDNYLIARRHLHLKCPIRAPSIIRGPYQQMAHDNLTNNAANNGSFILHSCKIKLKCFVSRKLQIIKIVISDQRVLFNWQLRL